MYDFFIRDLEFILNCKILDQQLCLKLLVDRSSFIAQA